MQLNQLTTNILDKKEITAESLIEYKELFLNDDYIDVRYGIYESYRKKYDLSSLAEAKFEILKNLFSKEIYQLNNLAQDICEYNIEKANDIIEEIKSFQLIFKSHDVINFKEFVAYSIPDMNALELNAIYEGKILSANDLREVSNGISSVISNKETKEINISELANHKLMELLYIPRKSKHLFDENNFGAYATLASALLKYNTEIYQEGFTGAIVYLSLLDMKYGLHNIKKNGQPKSIANILEKIDDGNFEPEDMQTLIDISTLNSENFDFTKGKIVEIKNSTGKSKVKGVMDRKYENFHIHDAGESPKKQNSQILRGAEASIHKLGYFPYVLQVSTDTAISKNMDCFNEQLSTRELISLSNLKNSSELIGAFLKSPIDLQKNTDPLVSICEIYTNLSKASLTYFNELNKETDPIKKIELFSDTIFSTLKNKLVTDSISNNAEDVANEFVILPFIELTRVLKKLSNSFPELDNVFNRGLSLIHEHKYNLTKYNFIEKQVENFLDISPKSVTFEPTKLNQDIEEISTPNRIIDQPIGELIKFFSTAKNEFQIQNLTTDEISYLRKLPENEIGYLLPLYQEMACRNIMDLYDGKKRGKTLDKVLESVLPLVNDDISERILSPRTMQDEFYSMLSTPLNPQKIDHIEILCILKELTNAEFNLTDTINKKFNDVKTTINQRKNSM